MTMAKETHVLILEDDFYSRKLMELLLRRDWRTRVLTDSGNPAELPALLDELRQHQERVDVVVIDADIPGEGDWLGDSIRILAERSPQTKIIFTSVKPMPEITGRLGRSNCIGYVLKEELRFSLAWAVALAADKHIVMTDGVWAQYPRSGKLPDDILVLDGRKNLMALSKAELRRARLAFIFSMERRELADEEGLMEGSAYQLVPPLYQKMGVNEILNGEVKPETYFGDHPAMLGHIRQIVEAVGAKDGGKAIDKETLAFHLLTMPEIKQIS
jgi:DNA-binding NarL/FixJ family response regulator